MDVSKPVRVVDERVQLSKRSHASPLVYKGRKPSIDTGEVLRLRHVEWLGLTAIARRLGIGQASVYRLLGKQASGEANGVCSHTVHAPAKPNPLGSHSMASNPWIVRRAVWND